MKSNHLCAVDGQAELALARRPDSVDVSIEIIRAQKTSGAAFSLACQASGLDDKEIYMPLGIDAGYFSRIKKNEATLQGDKLSTFCEIVGNAIYPEWQAYQIGCTLVMIQTEAERQIKLERDGREKAEAENKLLRDLLQGRAAP